MGHSTPTLTDCLAQIRQVPRQYADRAIIQLEATVLGRNFLEFAIQAWPIIEPTTPFHLNWHIEVIAEHLQALSSREIQKLIINIPPGFMKSILSSVLWPAWHWIQHPADRVLSGSYVQDLANRDAVRAKKIIKSPWYQARWPLKMERGADNIEYYLNTKTGWRRAVSVGGGTGQRAQVRILDDPHNIHEAESDVIRQGVVDWVRDTWLQRGADYRSNIELVIMQRVHERDVSGYLEREVGGYTMLVLPMEYEPSRGFVSSLTSPRYPKDPRTVAGELLDPERVPMQAVSTIKSALGPYRASGQLQQRPSPEEGGHFKKQHWRFWHWPGKPLPPYTLTMADGTAHEIPCIPLPYVFDREVQSWDCTFTDLSKNDYVSGQHWGKREAVSYLLRSVLERMDFVKTKNEIESMAGKFITPPGKILVERAANGPAVVASLQATIPGIIGVPPTGSKLARAVAYSGQQQAGQCVLPHPDIDKTSLDFIEHMAVFPNGLHDDDTDAWSQAMHELYGRSKHLIAIFPEFDEHAHLSRNPLEPVQGLKTFRLWFSGVYPTCLIGQVTRKGGMILYHSIQAENMGMEEFVRMRVVPVINQHYPPILEWIDIGPPSMMMHPTTKEPNDIERPAHIVERVLSTTMVKGHHRFQDRIQVAKEIFNRRAGILINCERTPGETANHLVNALQSEYGYELDPQTQHVKRETPFMAVPGYAVGEALTTGMAHFYAEPLQEQIKAPSRKTLIKRAEGYAVG